LRVDLVGSGALGLPYEVPPPYDGDDQVYNDVVDGS